MDIPSLRAGQSSGTQALWPAPKAALPFPCCMLRTKFLSSSPRDCQPAHTLSLNGTLKQKWGQQGNETASSQWLSILHRVNKNLLKFYGIFKLKIHRQHIKSDKMYCQISTIISTLNSLPFSWRACVDHGFLRKYLYFSSTGTEEVWTPAIHPQWAAALTCPSDLWVREEEGAEFRTAQERQHILYISLALLVLKWFV